MGKTNHFIKMMSAICFWVLILTSAAMGLDYPNKAIQIIVPVPAGGTCDISARIIAPRLASALGQPVIVVNKPGGGGAVATKMFVSATEPDGYTVLTHHPGILLIPILNPRIGYKMEDLIGICRSVFQDRVIVVKADAPWKTLGDFIKDAQRNPGKFTYSTGGVGSGAHFHGELFKIETGTNIVHVPMEGDAVALTALIGGHVDMIITGPGVLRGHLKAGSVRALALLSPERNKNFPDIPTIKDIGYGKTAAVGWFGYFAHSKTPVEIVEKLGKAFEIALKDKEVINKLEKVEMLVDPLILGKAAQFFEEENEKWSQVAQKARMVTNTTK